jgi:hypothetical protein
LDLLVRRIPEFLQHATLKYHWIRYLPVDGISDPFWKPLQTALIDSLGRQDFFFNHVEKRATPSKLRIVSDIFRDHENKPLFDDESAWFTYVSEKYSKHECTILRKLGAQSLTSNDFVSLVKLDLEKINNTSRMKASSSSTEWHTCVAKLLYASLGVLGMADQVRVLPLVPLTKGTWVVPKNASIFFPTCGGIPIPPGLDQLNIVSPEAVVNRERLALFERLNVRECKPVDAFDAIEKRYAKGGTISCSIMTSDLKFIYWHHNEIRGRKPEIEVAYRDGRGLYRCSTSDLSSSAWLYTPLPVGPYSAASVFKSQVPEQLQGKLRFLDTYCYGQVGQCETRHGVPPLQWLEEYIGARTTVQLFQLGSRRIPSPEFIHITTQRSELLLGILATNWADYLESKPLHHEIKTLVSQAEIPILYSDAKVKVEETFLPSPEMAERVRKLGLQEGFGFIKEVEHSDGNWRFLSEFGVGVEQDLKFWLAVLKKARETPQIKILAMRDIYFQLWGFSNTTSAQETVRYVYMLDSIDYVELTCHQAIVWVF